MPMSTSRIKAKAKLKKGIARIAKMKTRNEETCKTDESDLSELRKPIDINLSSPKQIAQLLEKGSNEVRDILTYECDVIYECRICRSLFRSLANLISHKRVYCPEKYSAVRRRNSADHSDSGSCRNNRSDKTKLVDYDCKENCSNGRALGTQTIGKEPKKDLTSVVDMLTRKQNNDFQSGSNGFLNGRQSTCSLHITNDNEQVLLEMMDSNQAAYQTILSPDCCVSSNGDLMKTQAAELKLMSNQSTAVLGPDGQIRKMYSSTSRYSNQDDNDDIDSDVNILNSTSGEDLTCTTCNAKFATKKTLTFHVKCKHTPHQVDFPCPCCSNTFTNRWSVYRHLFKVHRKSNEQVRRLRSQIQARSFESENKSRLEELPIALVEAAQPKIVEKSQEWMENLELNGKLQRCVACGKRFDRKAALMSHLQICKKRVTAVGASGEFSGRHKTAKKKPPQRFREVAETRRDSSVVGNRTLTTRCASPAKRSPTTERRNSKTFDPQQDSAVTIVSESAKKPATEIEIRVEDVSSLSKDVWDMIGNDDLAISSELVNNQLDSLTTIEASQSVATSAAAGQSVTTAAAAGQSVATAAAAGQSASTAAARGQKSANAVRATANVENSDAPEVIYTSIENSRAVTLSVLETEKKLGIQYRGIRLPTVTLEKIDLTRNRGDAASQLPIILPSATAADSTTNLVDKAPSPLTTIRKLQCLPCNRQFMSLLNMRRHNALHQKRSRFRCKLCDFKAFLKCDVIAHCNKKHNARNDRLILSELIIEIPINNNLADNDAEGESVEMEKTKELEVIDLHSGATKAEIRVEKSAKTNQRDKQNRNENISSPIGQLASTMPTDPPVKEKPRRGRPPKSKGRKKKKTLTRKKVRKVRHVSPPTLREIASEEIADIADSMEAVNEQRSTSSDEPSCFKPPPKMDCDPELRKMVMEVIFGSAENQINNNTDKLNDGIAGEDITAEQFEVKRLEDQRDYRKLNVSSMEIDLEKCEDITIECDQDSLSNNNLQHDLKPAAASFREEVSIIRGPLKLANKMPTSNRFVQLQTCQVERESTLFSGLHLENLPSTPHETVRLIIYEHDDGNDTSSNILASSKK